jgi:hypothetical protein
MSIKSGFHNTKQAVLTMLVFFVAAIYSPQKPKRGRKTNVTFSAAFHDV